MALDLKTGTTQLRALWTRLPMKKRAIIIGALALTIAGLWYVTRAPSARYSVVFSGLSAEDAGEVVAAIESRGVPHRLEAGGSAVSVPADRVLDLRLDLAEQGLPRGGGVGFEIFDRQQFGTTSFVEQMNYRRALQGELGRTIGSLDAVDAARVHLALGARSLYKTQDDAPSASVVVRLRRGRVLSPAQVGGIVHLVSSSIDGLTAERVTLVDESGAVLSADDAADGGGQHELEQRLSRRVQDLIEKLVGPGHVAVSVTAELDRSQVASTEETYTDPGVVRSDTRMEERLPGSGGTAGVAGARGNLPPAPAPGLGPSTDGLVHFEESHTYEVSKLTRSVAEAPVRIAKLHVAVLVDDLKASLPQIEAIAREAAGLDDARGDRITVSATPFTVVASEDAPAATPASSGSGLPGGIPIWAAAAAGGAGLLILAMIGLMIRAARRRGKKQQALPRGPLTVAQLEQQLEPGATTTTPLALPGRDARDRALEAARGDTARAAQVIRLWLAEAKPLAGGS